MVYDEEEEFDEDFINGAPHLPTIQADLTLDPWYNAWIDTYYPTPEKARNMCDIATRDMRADFPELVRMRGHYGTLLGWRQHWWLMAPDGSIVDPTWRQFPLGQCYRQIDESQPDRIPTGKCMGCGGHVYLHATFCCSDCEEETMATPDR